MSAPHPPSAPIGSHAIHTSHPWAPWRRYDRVHHRHTTLPAPAEPTKTGQTGHTGHDLHLLGGVSAFQRDTAPLVREELARLAREGQRPPQLFLTCADSRLVTSMITSSGPGDLFTVRNVGNLVPPVGSEGACDSVAAAIEYAVEVLEVGSITVCGHSGCGAMQALLDSGRPAGERTPLARWLRHARPSLERLPTAGDGLLADRAPADDTERLCLVNIVQQLRHLMGHPSVARRAASGKLRLNGLYFHVAEAQAYLLDPVTGAFSAVRPEAGPQV